MSTEQSECTDCDPGIVDCLQCKADGVDAQAKYNDANLPDLRAARTQYDTTRGDYRTARHSVALEVQELRHQAKLLVERVRCLIKQEHVVHRLDEAYEIVESQLRECGCDQGCCVHDDGDFDTDTEGLDDKGLADRIADYQRRVDAAKACFTDLVKEPAALVARVADIKTELSGIQADLSGDPAKTDLKELYARARVAAQHVHVVWRGFKQTNDFVDCLCRALTVWSKGVAAIAILLGEQAVRKCHEDARKARCDYLRTNTVKEVLAVYDRLVSHHGCEDDEAEAADES